jgi:hypothetical protein
MTPIVFLDIDGVLNNTPWMNRNDTGTLDPDNVALLVSLIEQTKAVIVVSSDWRRWHEFDALCRLLRRNGVPDCIIGVTPVGDRDDEADWSWPPRGIEIDAWLKSNNWSGSFVILDDRDDMEPHMDRLVLTDHECGLTESNVSLAISILSERDVP